MKTMRFPKKNATPQVSRAWRESIPPELSDGGTFTEGDAGKGLRPSCGLFLHKKIRAVQLEKHQARSRNAAYSPLRNGLCCDLAEFGNLYSSAQFIDNFVRINLHSENIKACLTY